MYITPSRRMCGVCVCVYSYIVFSRCLLDSNVNMVWMFTSTRSKGEWLYHRHTWSCLWMLNSLQHHWNGPPLSVSPQTCWMAASAVWALPLGPQARWRESPLPPATHPSPPSKTGPQSEFERTRDTKGGQIWAQKPLPHPQLYEFPSQTHPPPHHFCFKSGTSTLFAFARLCARLLGESLGVCWY